MSVSGKCKIPVSRKYKLDSGKCKITVNEKSKFQFKDKNGI